MKLLYAAANNKNAKIQLSRFLEHWNKPIKISAYKISSPKNIQIDWTLDCCVDKTTTVENIFMNDMFSIYYDQIKKYKPDLIVCDMEEFTSYIANDLNIPLIQCSSSLFTYALPKIEKVKYGYYKKYAYLTYRNMDQYESKLFKINISNVNYIYSIFGDLEYPPKINDNFEFVRPYYKTDRQLNVAKHKFYATSENKNIISFLNKQQDAVLYSNFLRKYNNFKVKNYDYDLNITNCDIAVNDGNMNCLADAYYNSKFSLIFPDLFDRNSVIQSISSQVENIGKLMFSHDFEEKNIIANFNNVEFLHEKIERLI